MGRNTTVFTGTYQFVQAIVSVYASLQAMDTVIPLYYQTTLELSQINGLYNSFDLIIGIEQEPDPIIQKGKKRDIDQHLKDRIEQALKDLRKNLQEAEVVLHKLIKVLQVKEYNKDSIKHLDSTLKRFNSTYVSLNHLERGLESRPEWLNIVELGKVKTDVTHFSNNTTYIILKTLLNQYG